MNSKCNAATYIVLSKAIFLLLWLFATIFLQAKLLASQQEVQDIVVKQLPFMTMEGEKTIRGPLITGKTGVVASQSNQAGVIRLFEIDDQLPLLQEYAEFGKYFQPICIAEEGQNARAIFGKFTIERQRAYCTDWKLESLCFIDLRGQVEERAVSSRAFPVGGALCGDRAVIVMLSLNSQDVSSKSSGTVRAPTDFLNSSYELLVFDKNGISDFRTATELPGDAVFQCCFMDSDQEAPTVSVMFTCTSDPRALLIASDSNHRGTFDAKRFEIPEGFDFERVCGEGVSTIFLFRKSDSSRIAFVPVQEFFRGGLPELSMEVDMGNRNPLDISKRGPDQLFCVSSDDSRVNIELRDSTGWHLLGDSSRLGPFTRHMQVGKKLVFVW